MSTRGGVTPGPILVVTVSVCSQAKSAGFKPADCTQASTAFLCVLKLPLRESKFQPGNCETVPLNFGLRHIAIQFDLFVFQLADRAGVEPFLCIIELLFGKLKSQTRHFFIVRGSLPARNLSRATAL